MTITVYGVPAPQGSKRHVGRGIMIESSKKLKPWREAVKAAAIACRSAVTREQERLFGPVDVVVWFFLPRPKSRAKAPYADRKPDIDKLVRGTLDALVQAGTIEDDARVVYLETLKQYADEDGHVGATITVKKAPSVVAS